MIENISLDLLDDHPDNPRLIWREDVIEGIVAQLEESGSFDPAHALLVRPVDGRYQIIRGHHRRRAAVAVGLETVPCWVRELSDDDAYMQLALGNVQGELSPLEIGVHALKAVNIGVVGQGRGNEGGLGQYADLIGKQRQNISSYRSGAEVLDTVRQKYNNIIIFLDKAMHLAAISSAPSDLWPALVEWVIEGDKSVNQTQELTKVVRRYDIPDEWAFFLPLQQIVTSYLVDETPTPAMVEKLVKQASINYQAIETHCSRLPVDRFGYTVDQFRAWLEGGIGGYAWDISALQDYLSQVTQAAKDAAQPQPVDVQAGKWYQLGRHWLYCGDTGTQEFWKSLPAAGFAFADPPYNANLDEWDSGFVWDHDWLIEKAPIVAVTPGIESIAEFFSNLTTMPYVWSLSCWIDNGMTRGKVGYGNWVYVALFSTGDVYRQSQDMIRVSIDVSERKKVTHKGRKPFGLITQLIEIFSEPDDVIIDPFLGSGTTLFAAESTGRRCYGGEIELEFCRLIIEEWHSQTGIQVVEGKHEENTL